MKSENQDLKIQKLAHNIAELQVKVNDSVKLLMIGSGGNKSSHDSDSYFDTLANKDIKDRADQAVQECLKIK